MSQFTLRPARADEELIIGNLIGAVYDEFGASLKGDDQTTPFQPTTYRNKGGEAWLLECNGAVFGFIGVIPQQIGGALLKGPYLSPAWRCLGLGRLLIETALDHCRLKHVLPVTCILPEAFIGSKEKLLPCGFREAEVASASHSDNDGIWLQYG